MITYLGGIAAAVTAIVVLVRMVVVRPLLRWLREQLQPQIDQVRGEVSPDGPDAGSLKETVGRIENRVTELDARLDAHVTNHPGRHR